MSPFDVQNDDYGLSPGFEPKDCTCKPSVEARGIKYEPDFHMSEDKTEWICDYCGKEQTLPKDEDENKDEDGPGYEPENCECKKEVERNGVEYTPSFHSSEDKTYWICDHCGRTQ